MSVLLSHNSALEVLRAVPPQAGMLKALEEPFDMKAAASGVRCVRDALSSCGALRQCLLAPRVRAELAVKSGRTKPGAQASPPAFCDGYKTVCSAVVPSWSSSRWQTRRPLWALPFWGLSSAEDTRTSRSWHLGFTIARR